MDAPLEDFEWRGLRFPRSLPAPTGGQSDGGFVGHCLPTTLASSGVSATLVKIVFFRYGSHRLGLVLPRYRVPRQNNQSPD